MLEKKKRGQPKKLDEEKQTAIPTIYVKKKNLETATIAIKKVAKKFK